MGMTQDERLLFLIRALLDEDPRHARLAIPRAREERWRLLRSLMNVRPPRPVNPDVLRVQDEFLTGELARRGTVQLEDLQPVRPDQPNIHLWRGDITRLATDAVVNAANSPMLGCFVPCHGCIDNAIHTYAGMQLRLACADLMARQGHDEPTGQAKITPAFNLPSTWVLHTVGPVVRGGEPSERDCELLASSYRTCLELAFERGLRSVAFCCISTGEFGFPQREAARIAVRTVHDVLDAHRGRQGADCGQQGTRHGQKDAGSGTTDGMKVVFDVFTASDERIYQELLA